MLTVGCKIGVVKTENAIKRIAKLKKIGSFKEFLVKDSSTSAGLGFSDVNLFYGYNGSGKTMLTRVFSCLNDGTQILFDNKGEQLVDFTGGEIEITCGSDSVKSFAASTIRGKIKVFNEDFVEKNLALKSGKANKLSAIIGEHNIAIKNEIIELEEEKAKLYIPNKGLKAQIDITNAMEALNNIKRGIAADIRTYLHIDNSQLYTIKRFEEDLGKYETTETLLTEADQKAAGDIYLAEVKPPIDGKYSAFLDSVSSILALKNYTDIFDLLKTPIRRESAKLKEEVIKWIEEGAVLHMDDHDTCKFCGQIMSTETWDTRSAQIRELIKKDDKFEELEKQLATAKHIVAEYAQRLMSSSWELTEIQFFTKELFAEYRTARTAFDMAHADFSAALKKLKAAIEEKEKNKGSEKPFDAAEDFEGKVLQLSNTIISLKNTIKDNNSAISESGQLKQESRKKVVRFYIQQNKEKIDAAEADVKAKSIVLETAKQTSQRFDDDICAKNAILENQEENIKRINGFLEQTLDVGLAFKIEQGSHEYQLERKVSGMPNIPAKNLSEGEKNIVAFLYFLVSLDSSSAESKKNEIIVIDDPVSSLDSNNLFILQNLVVKTLKAYGQQFFLTHNFYFFAKVRESLIVNIRVNGGKVEEKMKIFEIKNCKEVGSRIEKANKFVETHMSEYMSIMESLHKKLKAADDVTDITTGNLIRRALEVFLCFKDTDKNHYLFYKLQKMAGDDIKYQSLLNMANAFSHTEIGENADLSYVVGKKEIRALFSFMKKNDPDHFEGFGIKLEESDI